MSWMDSDGHVTPNCRSLARSSDKKNNFTLYLYETFGQAGSLKYQSIWRFTSIREMMFSVIPAKKRHRKQHIDFANCCVDLCQLPDLQQKNRLIVEVNDVTLYTICNVDITCNAPSTWMYTVYNVYSVYNGHILHIIYNVHKVDNVPKVHGVYKLCVGVAYMNYIVCNVHHVHNVYNVDDV